MTNQRDSPDQRQPTERRPARRPWKAPRLTEYGPVSKLTQSGQGSITDGGTMAGMNMMVCL